MNINKSSIECGMMQIQFNMTTQEIILEAFHNEIKSEGLFWRINRPNTFIDLLMLEALKASNHGVNMSIAVKVVITSLKALINDRYGMLDYKLNFEEITKQILQEEDKILSDIKYMLTEQLKSNNQLVNNPFNDLNYFKVLNNLEIDNYSVQIFENLLISFLVYIEANK